MVQVDSVDKIVDAYFSCVAAEEFVYKKKTYKPRELRVSPQIFRGFTCPPGCGACCFKFSLDYIPSERSRVREHVPGLVKRSIEFNGRAVSVWSDFQAENETKRCKHLTGEGRCGLYRQSREEGSHGMQPFTCDFELVRFSRAADDDGVNYVNTRLFGRAWAMTRIDDQKGAMCTMTPADKKNIPALMIRFTSLKAWCEHFGLAHNVDAILKYIESGPWEQPLIIPSGTTKRGFFV